MTNTRLYAAVAIEENGKYYAYMIPFRTNDNALCKLQTQYKWLRMINANIFTRRAECEETVHAWREAYLANGTAMFAVH